jgi:hypothetical protein
MFYVKHFIIYIVKQDLQESMVEMNSMESMETVEMDATVSLKGAEETDVPSEERTEGDETPKGVIIRGKDFNPPPNEIDLYGNIQLHHSVSHSNPDESLVKSLLEQYPEGAEKKNQFGRIPLHYVLDRGVTSISVTKMLLKSFPGGACVEDNEGNTPYDLALHWHHSKRILRLLLKPNKYQDLEMWRRLEYGYLYEICFCCCCFFRAGSNPGGGDQIQSSSVDEDDNSHKLVKG